MTQNEKIKKLEDEIDALKTKIAALEARPTTYLITQNPIPAAPYVPTYPYYGNPPYPVTTCLARREVRHDFGEAAK